MEALGTILTNPPEPSPTELGAGELNRVWGSQRCWGSSGDWESNSQQLLHSRDPSVGQRLTRGAVVGWPSLVVGQGPKRGGGGGGGDSGGGPGEAAQGPGLEGTLHRPEHHAEQHKQEGCDERHAPPVPTAGPAADQAAPMMGRSRGSCGHSGLSGLAQTHIHTHKARCWEAAGRGRGAVAQSRALQPHGLLLSQVPWQLGLQLAAGAQCRGPGSRYSCGLPAERAGHSIATRLACRLGSCQPRQALQAEDVAAGELLGRLEDVVIAREADGAL